MPFLACPSSPATAAPALLPFGWEQREDAWGRTYYQNNTTKTATWQRPTLPLLGNVRLGQDVLPRQHHQDHYLAPSDVATTWQPAGRLGNGGMAMMGGMQWQQQQQQQGGGAGFSGLTHGGCVHGMEGLSFWRAHGQWNSQNGMGGVNNMTNGIGQMTGGMGDGQRGLGDSGSAWDRNVRQRSNAHVAMPMSSAWPNQTFNSQAQLPNRQAQPNTKKAQPNTKRRNIEINQRITGSKDATSLVMLVETCVAEFNHVNVATAFRKLLPLQDRARWRVPR